MNENLKAIMRAASEDDELMAQASELMNELSVATDETRPEVVARIIALANDNGFTLTEDDLVVEAPAEGELEDEELMVVAGGCDDEYEKKANCGGAAFCGSSNVALPAIPIPTRH